MDSASVVDIATDLRLKKEFSKSIAVFTQYIDGCLHSDRNCKFVLECPVIISYDFSLL